MAPAAGHVIICNLFPDEWTGIESGTIIRSSILVDQQDSLQNC